MDKEMIEVLRGLVDAIRAPARGAVRRDALVSVGARIDEIAGMLEALAEDENEETN